MVELGTFLHLMEKDMSASIRPVIERRVARDDVTDRKNRFFQSLIFQYLHPLKGRKETQWKTASTG
jgi:hypothetical protein